MSLRLENNEKIARNSVDGCGQDSTGTIVGCDERLGKNIDRSCTILLTNLYDLPGVRSLGDINQGGSNNSILQNYV